MRFSTVVATVAVAALPALGANFDVTVGASNGFTFTPSSISGAVAGDTVTFTFVSRNHTATTTTFTNPCPPPAGGEGPGGFDTGFQNAVGGVQPVSVVTLADSGTHFVSCRQAAGAHCQAGMVLVINPTEDQSLAAFTQHARNDPIQTDRL
ncbi:hypothetical protein K435DRAFT_968970 [Dendrothele bispora CBS 962.96]|uniref:Cupredoxin n=1 Tax=Dendrothele bispora (strain CBS 962.96) TaxID=1314807 RepID=A0A4S8LKA9_DENBC|nr:hypothetical protein K435DRAFT_968970 [Dendrothele bispora CBS 962.96]